MVCQKRSYKDKEYRYYICKTYHKYGRSKCDQANINADKLEKAVVEIVRNRLSSISMSKIIASANRNDDIERLHQEEKKILALKEQAQKGSS